MVARITKSTSVSAALNYHTQLERQDDQLKGVDRPGRFQGEASEYLGIKDKESEREAFKALLEGKHPNSGEQMVRVMSGRRTERVPGWDFTFSPDKSVSVAWAAANEEIAQGIEKAQREASQRAMQYVEQNFAFTRTGAGGKIHEPVAGLVWSRHDHFLSRSLDPQLHTHNFIFNAALKENGKWGAIHSKHMYQAQKQAQLIYHAELAQRLERLGFQLQIYQDKGFSIKGIPLEVLQANSNRRQQILEATNDYRHKTASSFENAALMTRDAKVRTDVQELVQIWNQRHAELNFGPEKVAQLLQPVNSLQQGGVAAALSAVIEKKYGLKHSFGKIAKRALPTPTLSPAAKRVGNLIGSVAKQANKTMVRTLLPANAIRRALTVAQTAKGASMRNQSQGGRVQDAAQDQAKEQVVEKAKERARER